MPVLFNCPVCRKRLSVSRRKIGEKVNCPSCSSLLEVPAGKKKAAPPPVEFAEAQKSEAPPPPAGEIPPVVFAENEDNRLDESEVSQESETPTAGVPVRSQGDVSSDTGGKTETLESLMWSRPATESREPEVPIQFRRANDEFEEMDLTPMVDVTFLLLIFFMITASFTLEKTIPTPVPDPNDQSAAQPIQQQDDLLEKSIMIGINADNTITIDEEPLVDAALLRDRLTDLMLKEKKAEALVTVADLAMQETVVYVLDTANDVGMQKIRLAAAPGGVN